jgi:hypothetical protein
MTGELVNPPSLALPPGISREEFFLGPTWTEAYWRHTPLGHKNAYDLRVQVDGSSDRVVIGMLGRGTRSVLRLFKTTCLALNRSMALEMDDVSVEVNGFCKSDSGLADAWRELIHRFLDDAAADELVMDSLSSAQLQAVRAVCENTGLLERVTSTRLTYWVDFQFLKQQGFPDYLASRSANLRQQLRRSRRRIEKQFGELKLELAGTDSELDGWLGELAKLHLKRWGDEPGGSGFRKPAFFAHQHDLMKSALSRNELHFFRVSAGDQVLAFIACFADACGALRFYIGAVDYDMDPAFKPGLISHLCVIEYLWESGAPAYDFLGGTAAYKQALCSHAAEQTSIVLSKKSLPLVIEHVLRRAKRRLKPKRPQLANQDSKDAQTRPAVEG